MYATPHQSHLAAFRELSEQVQTELANANCVADEVLSNTATVRAHAAQESAKAAYHANLLNFYSLHVDCSAGSHSSSASLQILAHVHSSGFSAAVSVALQMHAGFQKIQLDEVQTAACTTLQWRHVK